MNEIKIYRMKTGRTERIANYEALQSLEEKKRLQ